MNPNEYFSSSFNQSIKCKKDYLNPEDTLQVKKTI